MINKMSPEGMLIKINNVTTAVATQQKDDAAFMAANPEPSVEGDEFGRKRKATFEAAANQCKFRWKILTEFQIPGPGRCVDATFLSVDEADAIRSRLIQKLSDVWWR